MFSSALLVFIGDHLLQSRIRNVCFVMSVLCCEHAVFFWHSDLGCLQQSLLSFMRFGCLVA